MKNNYFILLLITFGFSQISFAQSKKRNYKTFHEKSYTKGDVILSPVILYYDSRLHKRGEDSLKFIADFLIAHPNLTVEIGVYTSQRGSNSYNMRLSQNRANHIVNYLNEVHIIPIQRMNPHGYGEENPIYSEAEINKQTSQNEKEKMYLANQRMEIKILSVK